MLQTNIFKVSGYQPWAFHQLVRSYKTWIWIQFASCPLVHKINTSDSCLYTRLSQSLSDKLGLFLGNWNRCRFWFSERIGFLFIFKPDKLRDFTYVYELMIKINTIILRVSFSGLVIFLVGCRLQYLDFTNILIKFHDNFIGRTLWYFLKSW